MNQKVTFDTTVLGVQRSRRRRGPLDLGDARRTVAVVWVVVVLVYLLMLLIRPNLAGISSMQTIVSLAAITAVAGLGQGTVVFGGGIDMSIPWVLSSSAILFTSVSGGSNDRSLLGAAVAVLFGAAMGMINGFGVSFFGIHPVVMTLALSAILEGSALGWTGGAVTGSPPPAIAHFMKGSAGSMPAVIPALIILTVIVCFVHRQTRFGREYQAVGLNPAASRLAGVRSKGIIIATYMISGVSAALAGMMLSGLAGQSYLAMGSPYLLMSVAVVALGGAAFAGGRGHFLGTLGGAILLSMLVTLLMTFQLPEAVRTIVQGFVILVAVVFASIEFRQRRRRVSEEPAAPHDLLHQQ
jgi:ribose transport system permease protein